MNDEVTMKLGLAVNTSSWDNLPEDIKRKTVETASDFFKDKMKMMLGEFSPPLEVDYKVIPSPNGLLTKGKSEGDTE